MLSNLASMAEKYINNLLINPPSGGNPAIENIVISKYLLFVLLYIEKQYKSLKYIICLFVMMCSVFKIIVKNIKPIIAYSTIYIMQEIKPIKFPDAMPNKMKPT
jgi:hypothetical protein